MQPVRSVRFSRVREPPWLSAIAAEDEADAGAGGFRREERHEEVPGIGDAGAIVGDSDLKCARDLLGRTPRCDVMEVFLSRS